MMNNVGRFTCKCLPGWDGRECEFGKSYWKKHWSYEQCNMSIWFLKWLFFLFADIDECLHRSCLNNATCLNTPGSFVCQCNTGWEGNICERGEVSFFNGLYLHSCFFLRSVWYIAMVGFVFLTKTQISWTNIFFQYYLIIIIWLWTPCTNCLTVDDVFMFQIKMNAWTSLVKMTEPVLIL